MKLSIFCPFGLKTPIHAPNTFTHFFSLTSICRMGFKCWPSDRTYCDLKQHFHCACAETATHICYLCVSGVFYVHIWNPHFDLHIPYGMQQSPEPINKNSHWWLRLPNMPKFKIIIFSNRRTITHAWFVLFFIVTQKFFAPLEPKPLNRFFSLFDS